MVMECIFCTITCMSSDICLVKFCILTMLLMVESIMVAWLSMSAI